jgi:hypothetical protein
VFFFFGLCYSVVCGVLLVDDDVVSDYGDVVTVMKV